MSAKRSHQPDIAGCILAVISAAKKGQIDISCAVDAVASKLDLHQSGTVPSKTFTEVASSVLSAISKEAVVVELPENSGQTQDAIARLISMGVDGEAFAWAVIRYEAQYHTRLVWMEANRVAQSQKGRSAEDLAGWGWLGLRQAMRQFNPSLGYKFSTYAMVRIKGSIRDGIRSENPIPKRLLTLQRKVALATEDLQLTLGRTPSLEEISLAVDKDAATLGELLPRLTTTASVDEILASSEEDGTLINSELFSESDPYISAEEESRREAIAEALEQIDPRYAESVRLVVCEGLSVAETRRRTGVSDREIRRRVARGLKALAPLLLEWEATA